MHQVTGWSAPIVPSSMPSSRPPHGWISNAPRLSTCSTTVRQHVAEAADVGGEVVPSVRPLPVLREVLGGVVDAVRDLDRAGLDAGPPARTRAEHVGQELPAGLGLDRRADTDEAAAIRVVVLERLLLSAGEQVAGRVEEDHRAVLRQVRGGELAADRGWARCGDREAATRRDGLDRRDAGRRELVLGARRHEHLVALGRSRRREHERKADDGQRHHATQHPFPPPHRHVLKPEKRLFTASGLKPHTLRRNLSQWCGDVKR